MSDDDAPEPILLPQLPDESLLMIMELLPPAALTHLGAACRALQTVAVDEKLWATHCARHKVKADATATARAPSAASRRRCASSAGRRPCPSC